MKKGFLLTLVAVLMLLSSNSYALTSFWQSGIAVDNVGEILDNANVDVRVTIYDAAGSQLYQQTFPGVPTGQFAVFQVEVDGSGTGNFAAIDADAGTLIKVESNAGSGWVLTSMQSMSFAQYNTTVVPGLIGLTQHHIIMGDAVGNGEDVAVGGELTATNNTSGTALFVINNNAITNAKMADDAIDTPELVDDAVIPAKIANGGDGDVLYTNSTSVEWHNFTDLETDPQVDDTGWSDGDFAIWDATNGYLTQGPMSSTGIVTYMTEPFLPLPASNTISVGNDFYRWNGVYTSNVHIGVSGADGVIDYSGGTFTFDDDILPTAYATYNLGSVTRIWANVYANNFIGAMGQSLTDGNGIVNFTYNGSAPATVTVDHDATLAMTGTTPNAVLGIDLNHANSWTGTQTFSTVDINGGAIDNTIIGATTEADAHVDDFWVEGYVMTTLTPNPAAVALDLGSDAIRWATSWFRSNSIHIGEEGSIASASGEDVKLSYDTANDEFDISKTTHIDGALLVDSFFDVGLDINLGGELTFDGAGPAVDGIVTTITNDDTKLPTSGAVFDAIATANSYPYITVGNVTGLTAERAIATDATLTGTDGGANGSYTFGIDLGNTNTWTAAQGFTGGISSDLIPTTDDTYDLGENTTPLGWRNLYLSNDANIGNDAFIGGDANIGNDANISNALVVFGNATFGDDATADVTTFLSRIGSDFVPTADGTYDLGDGTTPLRWDNVYANNFIGAMGQPLTDGNGIVDFSYDGSSAASVTVDHDATLAMTGTTPDAVLGIDLNHANHWTATQQFDVVNIDGGAIDGTTIGAGVRSSGAFTTLYADNNVTLGNSASDYLTVNAYINSDLVPTSATYNLGTSANRWGDLYLSGASIHIGATGTEGVIGFDTGNDRFTFDKDVNIAADITAVVGNFAHISVSGSSTLGDQLIDNVFLNGTVSSSIGDIIVADNIIPSGTHDLGASGTEWNNVYANNFIGAMGQPLTDGDGIADFSYDGSSAASVAIDYGYAGTWTATQTFDVSTGYAAIFADDIDVQGSIENSGGDDVTVNDHLVPATTNTYSLGSDALRWDDLWLNGASIHIGATSTEGVIGFDTGNDRFTFDKDVNVTGNGIFTATVTATGGFVGDLTGNASTATALATARDFSVSGDAATASAVSFDGTGNVTLAVTIQTGAGNNIVAAINDAATTTTINANRITEADPIWVAAEPNYANLGQAETITGNWVNTANPWADNEVADALTIDGGSVTNSTVTPGTGHVTADYFVGTGSTSNAVDLATAEVSGTLPIANGGTGATTANGALNALLPSQGGNSGLFLTTDGTSASWGAALTSEVDGVIGNEVTAATNTTLVRSGAGTSSDPYTLALNLTNANTWTGTQTFNDVIINDATVTGSNNLVLDGDAAGGDLTGSYPNPQVADDSHSHTASTLPATIVYSSGSYADPAWITSLAASKITGTVPVLHGGTGATTANGALNALLPSQGGNSGLFLTTDGTNASWGAALTSEVDGVIGNEVTAATNTTLVRSGAGTSGDPYTLALNLNNANSWTGTQTFNDVIINDATVTGSNNLVLDGDAAGGDLTGSYPNPQVADDSHSHTASTLPATIVYSSGSYADPAWITSLAASKITGTVPVLHGGTGATTASGARSNLGLGTIATQNANNVSISGGVINNTVIGGGGPTNGTFTNLQSNGNTTLGSDAADNITVNGEFVSTLVPNTTNTIDLGTSLKRWKDLYLSGNANISGGASIGGTATVTGDFTANGIMSGTIQNATGAASPITATELIVNIGTLAAAKTLATAGATTGQIVYIIGTATAPFTFNGDAFANGAIYVFNGTAWVAVSLN